MTTVRDCDYPWTGFVIWANGNASCCCYGSTPVGDIAKASPESVWNNPTMQSLRASLAAGVVHTVCQSGTCKYVVGSRATLETSTAASIEGFDDAWYVAHYFDVRDGIGRGLWTSGLEHYKRFGHREFRSTNAREWSMSEREEASRRGLIYRATLSWHRPPSVDKGHIVLRVAALNGGTLEWRSKGQGGTSIQAAAESYRRLDDVHRALPMYAYRSDLPNAVEPGQSVALELRVPVDDLPLGPSFIVVDLVCDEKAVRFSAATTKPLVIGVHRDPATDQVDVVAS